jgi:ribosomal protein S5
MDTRIIEEMLEMVISIRFVPKLLKGGTRNSFGIVILAEAGTNTSTVDL